MLKDSDSAQRPSTAKEKMEEGGESPGGRLMCVLCSSSVEESDGHSHALVPCA